MGRMTEPMHLGSWGIIDSTGILELIEFLGSRFEVEVSESETMPENLGSLCNLTEFVMSKRPIHDATC